MTTIDLPHDAELHGWFKNLIQNLARGRDTDLTPYLVSVASEKVLHNTRTRCRCHFIARDAHQRPLVNALSRKLAAQLIDYCIPRSRIAEAKRHLTSTGSTEMFSRLEREARDLFVQLDNSGESGELLLYMLLERLLNAPQLLCKMSLKTNSQMYVHGTDGVHVRLLDDGTLALYWCESKLHDRPASAISSCFDSIAPFLLDAGNGASTRDLHLVRDHLDTGNTELNDRLARYLLEDEPESLMREVRGASLIGFSLENYPLPYEQDGTTVRPEVMDTITRWFDAIARRIGEYELSSFEIEVFCLPMPSVSTFRTAFRTAIGIL